MLIIDHLGIDTHFIFRNMEVEIKRKIKTGISLSRNFSIVTVLYLQHQIKLDT